jgi:hypothetical protein
MTEAKVRQSLAVGVTITFIILLSTLNLLVPWVGSIFILAVGIIWTSIVRFIYGEE